MSIQLPKAVFTDIDGVWTDGGMYYSDSKDELKKFNTYDSAGVLFCRENKISVYILTGENSKTVERRASKLGLKETCFLGVKNKIIQAKEICYKEGISLSEVAFLGDDLNDMALLKKVGFSACPISAPLYVQEIVDWVIPIKGGEGVFRKFIEHILEENNLLEKTVKSIVSKTEEIIQ